MRLENGGKEKGESRETVQKRRKRQRKVYSPTTAAALSKSTSPSARLSRCVSHFKQRCWRLKYAQEQAQEQRKQGKSSSLSSALQQALGSRKRWLCCFPVFPLFAAGFPMTCSPPKRKSLFPLLYILAIPLRLAIQPPLRFRTPKKIESGRGQNAGRFRPPTPRPKQKKSRWDG
jgi:hypothetical protein